MILKVLREGVTLLIWILPLVAIAGFCYDNKNSDRFILSWICTIVIKQFIEFYIALLVFGLNLKLLIWYFWDGKTNIGMLLSFVYVANTDMLELYQDIIKFEIYVITFSIICTIILIFKTKNELQKQLYIKLLKRLIIAWFILAIGDWNISCFLTKCWYPNAKNFRFYDIKIIFKQMYKFNWQMRIEVNQDPFYVLKHVINTFLKNLFLSSNWLGLCFFKANMLVQIQLKTKVVCSKNFHIFYERLSKTNPSDRRVIRLAS